MFILPNLFTVSSIFCGFYGAVTAAAAGPDDDRLLYRACIAVLFAMVFDAVDGRVARLTKTQSEFGVQMDSLADVISFGAAPALIAWHWGLSAYGTAGLLACFVYCACGAIRLARFNVMAASSGGSGAFFLGLPIPAAAGLLVAVIISSIQLKMPRLDGGQWWAPAMMIVLGLLMVSNIRFRTFKATRMTRRVFAGIMIVFAAVVVLALQTKPSFAIVALMTTYLSYGLLEGAVGLIRGTSDDGEEDEDEHESQGGSDADHLEEELLD